jgi:hypothetical protein
MKSIHIDRDYSEILQRIESLTPDAARQWGSMNAAQMLTHVNLALEVSLGMVAIPSKSTWFLRTILKPMVFTFLPMPKNAPTSEALKVIDARDFIAEKQRLIGNVKTAHDRDPNSPWSPHAAFGPLTGSEWGKLHYKHMNHHLQQFAV